MGSDTYFAVDKFDEELDIALLGLTKEKKLRVLWWLLKAQSIPGAFSSSIQETTAGQIS